MLVCTIQYANVVKDRFKLLILQKPLKLKIKQTIEW